MLDLPEQWLSAEPREMMVNGARVQIISGRSDLSFGALLDHLQARCREQDGGVHALLQKAKRESGSAQLGILDGVLRVASPQEGVVACLQLGADPMTPAQLVDRLERFAEQLDLSVLGGVRMVRVSAREHGSFFVAAASEGSVSLTTMFPAQGDAPGVDFESLPRPANATRLLSAWQVDGQPAVNTYRAKGAMDTVWDAQLTQMTRSGWVQLDAQQAQSGPRHAALFWRSGRAAQLVAEPDEQDTLLSILPLDGGPGAVSVR